MTSANQTYTACPECGFRHSVAVLLRPGERHEVIHECPPGDSGLMPCCGRTPFEVPGYHRMTVAREVVTCRGSNEV